MTAQQEYWFKMNHQRQLAYARLMKAQAIARKLAIYAPSDITPDNPYYDEYCWLIDEFGERFFIDELSKFHLEKEQDKDSVSTEVVINDEEEGI